MQKLRKEGEKILLRKEVPKICHYCGIDEETYQRLELIYTLQGTKFKKLGVERVNPRRGYEEGNIVWCCSPCNNAKNFYFTEDEGKLLGKTISAIYQSWLEKLERSE